MPFPSTTHSPTHRSLRLLVLSMLLAAVGTFHIASTGANTLSGDLQQKRQAASTDLREKRSTMPAEGSDYSRAIDERTEMLTRSLVVTLQDQRTSEPLAVWQIDLSTSPLWVVYDVPKTGQPTAVVSEKRILQDVRNKRPFTLTTSQSCDLLSDWVDTFGVQRAQTSCIAEDGYTIDELHFAQSVRAALEQGKEELVYPVTFVPGVIRTAGSSLAVGDLKRLSSGHSDFKGSGAGRKSNVRKALTQHVNNVIVPAGAVYSFNDTIGPAVTTGNGWQMAYTIFNGADLIMAPGGGICQASTTMYRAAFRAGLPIVKQKNHSLYVVYYEKHGVGQDATVFPGKQDFQFLNDTGAPLLIQSYHEGDEAFVHVYGKDDGRSVTVTGPYFTSNAPAGTKVRKNEILWQRTIDGVSTEPVVEQFVARYNALPVSLPKKAPLTTQVTRGEAQPLHAAAE
ncbi:MAG: VanW family protein [Candidatus Peribacteraceae bacterium]